MCSIPGPGTTPPWTAGRPKPWSTGGCAVLGQHTDSTGAATMAEQLGAFYAGFGSDQRSHAPGAALLSVGVNWGIYFTQAVQGVLDGSGVPEEWNLGWAVGAVALTPLNESLAASGTQEALEAAEQALSAGELEVFSGPLQGGERRRGDAGAGRGRALCGGDARLRAHLRLSCGGGSRWSPRAEAVPTDKTGAPLR